MAEQLTQIELDAWQALLHTHHQLTRQLDAELRKQSHLSLSAYDVLLRLARAPQRRLRMSELAQRVMFSPSGLTRVVDRLVDDGLVTRRRDTGDARGVLAELTEAGRKTTRSAAKTHLRGVREHFTGRLSQQQLENLTSALRVICGPHEPH